MIESESVACDCWVIFTGSQKRNFILNNLDKCFKHVFLVKKSEGGTMWLILNPQGGNITFDAYPVSLAPNIRDLYPDEVIIKTRSKTQKDIPLRIWHINCVEVVKRALGVKNWRIITPYQLFKHLKGV